jgi:gliding motility associated protien GldN
MKTVYYIGLSVLLMMQVQLSWAQNAPRRISRQRTPESKTVDVKTPNIERVPHHLAWERTIYRLIDLTKNAENAALSYPVQAIEGKQNLFAWIDQWLTEDKITAYNYLEGGEIFIDAQKADTAALHKKNIPASEVTQYIVKEKYAFDQSTGTFRSEVLAICPVWVRNDMDFGLTRETLFWLPYEDLSPYLAQQMIPVSDYNTAITHSIDDYFRKQMYQGEIVKTLNTRGKSLVEEVGNDPEALKHAQDSIEQQIQTFRKNIWVKKH